MKSKIFSGMPIANTDWLSVSDFRIAADRSDISESRGERSVSALQSCRDNLENRPPLPEISSRKHHNCVSRCLADAWG